MKQRKHDAIYASVLKGTPSNLVCQKYRFPCPADKASAAIVQDEEGVSERALSFVIAFEDILSRVA